MCQDYAHLVLGALRHVGIPARYVSGYLHPRAEPGIGEEVIAESHAWVEWWLGEWVGNDPTNLAESLSATSRWAPDAITSTSRRSRASSRAPR